VDAVHHALVILRVDEIGPGLDRGVHLGAHVTKKRLVAFVPPERTRVKVPVPDRVGGDLREQPEALLTLAQPQAGELALGDVAHGADEALDAAGGILDGHGVLTHPADGAVGPDDPEIHIGFLPGKLPPEDCLGRGFVVGMDAFPVGKGIGEDAGQGTFPDLFVGGIDVEQPAVDGVVIVENHADVLGQLPETLLALAQLLAGEPRRGDVMKIDRQPLFRGIGAHIEPQVERRGIMGLEADRDIIRHRAAVFTLIGGTYRGWKLAPHVAAEQFPGFALKKLLRPAVEVGETPFPVHGKEGVGDAFQRGREPLRQSPGFLLGLPAAGDVLKRALHTDNASIPVPHRLTDGAHPEEVTRLVLKLQLHIKGHALPDAGGEVPLKQRAKGRRITGLLLRHRGRKTGLLPMDGAHLIG
jgi:hypothetical protein